MTFSGFALEEAIEVEAAYSLTDQTTPRQIWLVNAHPEIFETHKDERFLESVRLTLDATRAAWEGRSFDFVCHHIAQLYPAVPTFWADFACAMMLPIVKAEAR